MFTVFKKISEKIEKGEQESNMIVTPSLHHLRLLGRISELAPSWVRCVGTDVCDSHDSCF